MMTNKLDEHGISNKDNKGVNDQRLFEKANELDEGLENFKKATNIKANLEQYQLDKLLPKELMDELPYSYTLRALREYRQQDLIKLFKT